MHRKSYAHTWSFQLRPQDIARYEPSLSHSLVLNFADCLVGTFSHFERRDTGIHFTGPALRLWFDLVDETDHDALRGKRL